jgi:hypothetical protein
MTIIPKIAMTGIPFILLATDVPTGMDSVGGLAGQFMKYGELGLCFALVAYLVYSNYSLIATLHQLIQDKTKQEERLIAAIHTFCSVCRERPCLWDASAFKTENPNSIAQSNPEASHE